MALPELVWVTLSFPLPLGWRDTPVSDILHACGCFVFPSPSWRERVGVRVGQGILNRLQHRLKIAQHVVIPEPEHLIASVNEEFRTSLIGWDLSGMVATIDLHHEPVCRTTEIHDVRIDGMLAAKLGVMNLSVAQLPPQHPLTVGLPPSESSGEPTAPGPLTLTLSPKCGERGLFYCPVLPLRGEGSFRPLIHEVYPHNFRKSLNCSGYDLARQVFRRPHVFRRPQE